MKKKTYDRILITPLAFRLEGPVLNGSRTGKPIKLQEVTVTDFQDGFDSEPNDFKDIIYE